MKWLLLSEFLTNVVRGAFTLALGMILYQVTNSLWSFALVFLSDFVIALLMQSVAGVLIDKYGAGICMVLICLANALMFLGFSSLGDGLQGGSNSLIILGVLFNISRPFLRAGVFALTHQVAGDQRLEKANGYLAQAFQIGQMIGMATTGAVLAAYSPQVLWLILGSLFLIASASYVFIYLEHRQAKKDTAADDKKPAEKLGVLTIIKANPLIALTAIIGSSDFIFIAVFNLLLAPVVEINYASNEIWLTYLDFSFAIGAIAGGVYISKAKAELGTTTRYTMLSCLSSIAVFICFIYNPPGAVTLSAIFAFGFFITLSTVVWSTTLQKLSPPEVKGRIGALKLTVNSVAIAIASLMISFASDFGADLAMIAAAVLSSVLLLTLLLLSLKVNTKQWVVDA